MAADFLFDEISANLLQSGVLLREIHEAIVKQREDGTPDGALKSRLCALVFLIRKLPRDAGVDIGVRANVGTLADLLVENLANDGAELRGRLPALLDDLVDAGTLLKIEDEYSLQTRESSDWEAEFRNRKSRLANDVARMATERATLLGEAVHKVVGSTRLSHGASKELRRLSLHFSADPPADGGRDVPVWVRDGWGARENTVVADARAAGTDSPVIHVLVPRSQAEGLARLIADRDAAKATLEYKGVPSTPEGIEARQGMETRLTEAENNLRAVVVDVVGGARVIQGGGNERPESSLSDKVREAAGASLVRLFHKFNDADHDRWPKVIERTRAGAEHPLEVLDYSGKTEEHPVCAAVLAFVGAGKRGRDVRSHFSDPPYGWPRDAIDAALISLFGAGHLRATANGVALPPGQLDQAKVPSTDFRTESATISTHQRLKLRSLFQTAGIECKPNEETVGAGRLLSRLDDLARGAGGDAPLPECPDTRHLSELTSLAGNEQLLAILDRHDVLVANANEWTAAGALAVERLPAFQRLEALLRHAESLDVANEVKPQIEAIVAGRRLLDASDPVPGIGRSLVDALRTAVVEAESRHHQAYETERQRLEGTESWRTIEQENRDAILARMRIEKATKGAIGTEQEVLEAVDRISLDDWRTRTAALPQWFAEARAEADRLVEPRTRHLKLETTTLRTSEDVKTWTRQTEQRLLEAVEHGPIVID